MPNLKSFLPSILQNNPWGDPPEQSGGGWDRRNSGRNRNSNPPPDFEDFFKKGRDNFKNSLPPGFSGRNGWLLAGGVLAVLWLLSGVYSVAGGEQGVVLRFGKFDRTTPPGLHMHLPYPIETVLKPNTGIVNQIDIGNYIPTRGGEGTPAGQMLTQDKNILNMHFRILWRIDKPQEFLFNLRDGEATIRAAGESVMRELVGQRTFDSIVRGGRQELGQKAREMLQRILDSYQSGVYIVDVLPQKIDPPAEVIDAFNDVQRAEQDAEREVNQAEAYRSDIVPRARGEAERIKLDAEAYKARAQKEAEGEAQRFLSVYNAYKAASDVTQKRIYIETMQQIMQNSNKVYLDGKAGANALPFLPLQDLMKPANKDRNSGQERVQ